MGTPMTGRVVCAATAPRQVGSKTRRANEDPAIPSDRVRNVCGGSCGRPVGGSHPHLEANAQGVERLGTGTA